MQNTNGHTIVGNATLPGYSLPLANGSYTVTITNVACVTTAGYNYSITGLYDLGITSTGDCFNKSISIPVNVISSPTSIIGLDISIPFDANILLVKTVNPGSLLTLAGVSYDISYSVSTLSGTKLLIGISGNTLNNGNLILGSGSLVSVVFELNSGAPISNYSLTGATIIESYQTSILSKSITGTSIAIVRNSNSFLIGDIVFGGTNISLSNIGSVQTVLQETSITGLGNLNLTLTGANSNFSISNITTITGIFIKSDIPNANNVLSTINAFDAVVATKLRQGIASYNFPTYLSIRGSRCK